MSLPAAASVLSGGLGAYPTVYYDRVAVETLHSNLALYPAIDLKQMPDRNGVAMQIFDYSALSANTTPANEGTPGAGQVLTQNKRTLSLDQFVDYVTFSDKVILTAISDTVAEGAAELAYRGALSVDTVISTAVDAAAALDSATRIDIAHSSFMTAAKSRQAAMSLQATNTPHKANGLYYGVMHSLQAFDLINDSNAGGFIDLMKYTDGNAGKLQDGVKANRIGTVGGVEWFQSNAVPTEADWQSGGSIAYHAYVFGKNAFIGSSLGKTSLGQKNFSVKVSKFEQPVSSDPGRQIAAAAAYNFFFGVVKRPGSTNGFRRIRSESSIG